LKRFACGDVIPGCGGVFTGAGDQSVLDQVLAHVAADHGLVRPPLPFIELVMAHTHPFVPTRHGHHLRVVDPDAGRRIDTNDRRRPGNQSTPDGARDARVVARSSALSTGGTNGPMPGNVRRLGPGRPRPGKAHETYRHECVLYAGTGGFLDALVPFVRDGLARQEPVMVAVAEPRLRALRSALGEDAERVVFADMADLGHNPALIIPAWRDFTDRYSGTGRPVRGIGEPIWATRQPEEIAEAQLHEALLNMAVPPDVPLWLLCPYDTAALDEQVLAEAHRSHPVVVDSGDYRGSTGYGGTFHVEELFGAALPDPGAPITTITFDPHRHGHIRQILRSAEEAAVPADRAVKIAAAVDEIALAADRDTGRVTVRLWPEPTALVCQVTDPGMVTDPMIGRGSAAGPSQSRDRAIRLANELCDLVQVRSGSTGTTVRVHSSR
jgi:MEDS: MEthanogen/methylotroph, DcmR Sensory domain/Protein of unknown function (DUF1059)